MARPRLWHFGLTLPVALSVVVAFGLVRLGRQFPGAAESPGLLAPFVLPVLALGLEASAFVALSVAQLATLSRWDGPTQSWGRAVRATWPLAALLAVALLVAELIPRGTEHPGEFANSLVESARRSCDGAEVVPIPLIGLSVRCGDQQRLVGPMPGLGGAKVALGSLHFADDLRQVEVEDLDLRAPTSLPVRLRAGTARVAGLAPWSRSPRLGPFLRLAVLTALGAGLWLASAWVFRLPAARLPMPAPPRWRYPAWLLGALPGAMLATGFIALDQERAAPAAYSVALLPAIAALGALTLALRRMPKLYSYFKGF